MMIPRTFLALVLVQATFAGSAHALSHVYENLGGGRLWDSETVKSEALSEEPEPVSESALAAAAAALAEAFKADEALIYQPQPP